MSEENKDIVRSFVEELFNKGNREIANQLVSPDCVVVGAAESGRGPEPLLKAAEMLRNAFPDFHMAIEEIVAEENKVVVRTREGGTHRGNFLGIAPTNKEAAWRGVTMLTLENGKIIHSWGIRDRMEMMQQLGLMSGPPR
ncbi:MAG TPA: ester cyclase [Dehalococcoidia bacterium]|nr:ester cyclase [Dehalococcoidia bacterium]